MYVTRLRMLQVGAGRRKCMDASEIHKFSTWRSRQDSNLRGETRYVLEFDNSCDCDEDNLTSMMTMHIDDQLVRG